MELITSEGQETFYDDEDQTFKDLKQLLGHEPTMEEVAKHKEDHINKNIFKKTHQAKYLKKKAKFYENLAENILFTYFPAHSFGAAFDLDDKNLYIINLICPVLDTDTIEQIQNKQPSFSLKGIKGVDEFTTLVLAAGKKILLEQNLDRTILDEEFNEMLALASKAAEKYKD